MGPVNFLLGGYFFKLSFLLQASHSAIGVNCRHKSGQHLGNLLLAKTITEHGFRKFQNLLINLIARAITLLKTNGIVGHLVK